MTAAKLRLLPLLAHTPDEPGDHRADVLSPNTIRAEIKAIYRKLGATSRGQAVTRARQMGLLEG